MEETGNSVSRITHVEVGRYDYEFVGEFKFFKPDPDGVTRRPTVLVRLTDEDGVQGWGQSVPVPSWSDETVEGVESTLAGYLAEAVVGANPADFADIHRRMNQAIKPAFSVGQPLAKAAMDLACYDLVGKRRGCSVAQLLGGAKRGKIKLSWTVASPDMPVVERQIEEGLSRGYDSFNIKVGPPQDLDYDLAIVRKAVDAAPNGFHWVDANTSYSLEAALDIAPKLADLGVQALESPFPPARIRDYQALTRQRILPVLMDEGIVSAVEVAEFIALEMFDGIAMKQARCGGLWPSQQIVNLLHEHDKLVFASGLSDPDLSLIASVHLFAWADIGYPCALNGPQYIGETRARNKYLSDGDLINVPTGPGLGLALDERAESALSRIL